MTQRIDDNINVLFAGTDKTEKKAFLDLVEHQNLTYAVHFPANINVAEKIFSEVKVDIIITDLKFQSGAFADWLFLWPYPYILLTDESEVDKLDDIVKDESSSFLLKHPQNAHISMLPIMIRKVLNARQSLDRQNQHIQVSERRYLNLVQALPDIVYTLDDDGNFTFINNSVRSLGYDPVELIGKHFASIIEPSDLPAISRNNVLPHYLGQITGPEKAPKLFDERRTGQRMTRGLQIRIKRKQENEEPRFLGDVTAYGEVSSIGYSDTGTAATIGGTAGIIRDLSDRLPLETDPKAEEAAYEEAMRRQYHLHSNRALQLVLSLISLQQQASGNEDGQETIKLIQQQIYAISLLEGTVFELGRRERIPFHAFIDNLVSHLCDAFFVDRRILDLHLDIETLLLDYDKALPFSLIITEVISLSMLESILSTADTRLTMSVSFSGDRLIHFSYQDGGRGLSRLNEPKEDPHLQIIEALSDQLHGQLKLENRDGLSLSLFFNQS